MGEMRGRKKLLGFAVFLSVLLIVPLVFSFGVVDVSQFLFGSSPASSIAESSSTPSVFVDPVSIFDETKQSGSLVTFHVNVSEVTDLFAWQINMSWDPSILNVSRIIAGEFLLRTTSESRTAAHQLGFVINATDNARGYTAVGESILGGVSGEIGNGTLVSIEFLVTGYGSTDLTISLTGNLLTTLLNSTGETITFTKADGYFSNMIPGDLDCDGYVGPVDLSMFTAAYGKHEGDLLYNPDADLDPPGNPDGYIGPIDLSYFTAQYGKHV